LQYNNRINIKGVVQQVVPGSDPHSTYSMFFPSGLACFLGPASRARENNSNNNIDDGWTYWSLSVVVSAAVPAEFGVGDGNHPASSWYHGSPAQVQAQLLSTSSTGLLEEVPLRERSMWMNLIRATSAQQIVVQASAEAPLPESFFQQYHYYNENNNNHHQHCNHNHNPDDGSSSSSSTCTKGDHDYDGDLYVCRVGDAAHAMSASYGQAIAFAMEDAAVLGHCLSTVGSGTGTGNMTNRLTHYTKQRRDRCFEMQQQAQARAAYVIQHGRAPPLDNFTEWIHTWTLLPTNGSSSSTTTKQEQMERIQEDDEQMAVVG